jgi:hypothetical protein
MKKTQRTWLAWLAVVALILVICYQHISSRYIEGVLMGTRGNMKSLAFALHQFDSDYGGFPNAVSAKLVVEQTDSKLRLGAGSANEIFRQLVATGICGIENVYFSKISGAREPDNDFSHPEKVLAKGEVGFSYILGPSPDSPAETPLVVTPLVPGTNRFDPKPFKGRALVMRVGDRSYNDIDVLPINSRGKVIDSSGKHLLSPDHPVWGGKAPVIVWPE